MENSYYKKSLLVDNDNAAWNYDFANDDLCEENAANDILIMSQGARFCSVGNSGIKKYIIDEEGTPIIQMETQYRKLDYEITSSNENKIFSEILDFDEKTVTAKVYFSDHESKRIFKSKIRDCLQRSGLLQIGQRFYIDSEDTERGFNINIKGLSDQCDNETLDFFGKLTRVNVC